MSRKDYVVFAKVFRGQYDLAIKHSQPQSALTVVALARQVADAFAADNPNFDRERFLVAALGEDK